MSDRWIALAEALEAYRLRLGLPENEWAPLRNLVAASSTSQIWLAGQLFAIEDLGSVRMIDRAQFEALLETVAGAEER